MENKNSKIRFKFSTIRILICSLMFVVSFMHCNIAFSQSSEKVQIKGYVKEESGEVLIGATVSEKGTTNATITDINGSYRLTVSPNATLEITYLGYTTLAIPVGGKTTIDITLIEDNKVLDEVVVTALGIKRDRKSLGYALSEVKGDELLKNPVPNVANSLTGKVAGLQVKQASSGAGGSSRIVLRGNNSISGSNQPLIVVDGVPIDGGTGADNDDKWGETLRDSGSGMADISPDDIESISVLKGPAAAALYGSRAGNGVIMITTKTGKGSSGIGISYSTNLTFDSPLMKPKFQNIYGQGSSGQWDATSASSWGAKMEGQKYTNYIGKEITYSPGYMDMDDFLRTGNTWTNSLDITSSGEKSTVRVGAMHLRNENVVPNSDFKKTSVTLRATAELTKKLSVDAKVTYINLQNNNAVRLGGNMDNIFYQFLRTPRSVRLSDFVYGENGYHSIFANKLNPYAYPVGTFDSTHNNENLAGRPVSYVKVDPGNTNNPYWSAYNNTNNDRRNRFIGFASLKYEFTDWLNIQGRYGLDYTSSQSKDIHGSGSVFSVYKDVNGNLQMTKGDNYEMNTDILITLNKQLTEGLGLVATAGGNMMYARSESLWSTANGLGIEYFYNLSNAIDPKTVNSLYRKRINSIYATASLAWQNMLYLDLSARNDWSSALNSKNRSYFYPSVGASWLFSETFKNLGPFNYGKLRASWAQVGNDTDAYRLHNYRTIDGANSGKKSPIKANPDLKNETINSYEIGLELRALNDRIGLDFAFYNKEAKDQILLLNVPASTGYQFELINAGNIRNRGVELQLTGTPVKTKDFEWRATLNWAKNANKILKLHPDVKVQTLSHSSYSGEIRILAKEGGAYGDMYGKPYTRNEKGEIVVDENGLPTFESEEVKLGNSNPKWMGGLTNTFSYKGFDLSFQIDMSYGGDIYMGSYRAGASMGTLDFTAKGREEMIVHGVKVDGSVNDIKVRGDQYWSRLTHNQDGGAEPWIYDATNLRLRELSIGYSFPRKMLSKTPIKSLHLSFVGRNLWLIHSKTDGFDPESSYTTGNAQGYELGSMPSLRSLGFNVKVSF